ncbi:MAG: sulfite exporter TauE/SafE family protein [Promethearchaeota archaeon]
MDPFAIVILVVIGVFAGAIIGLSGISGSSSVVALLILLAFIPSEQFQLATGISLMVTCLGSFAATAVYGRHGNVDLGDGRSLIALGSALGAIVGAFIAGGAPSTWLALAFGIGLFLIGLLLVYRRGIKKRKALAHRLEGEVRIESRRRRLVITGVLGFIVGLLAGLLGLGGGGIVLLILLVVYGLPVQKAVGTSLFIMAITTLSGSAVFALQGNIDLFLGLIIGVGAIVSGVLCSRVANRVDERIAGTIMGVAFVILGLLMIILSFLPVA